MEELNIPAIALTADTAKNDPGVWRRVRDGEYRIIYATEEVILDKTGPFSKDILRQKSCKFLENLCLVAIDECHCAWGWQHFRRKYAYLGNLRQSIPRVPWLSMSATLTKHTMAYVHEVSNLNRPTYRISLPLRRDNINIIVAPIDGDDIHPLYNLIQGIDDPKAMPKTIIYCDNVDQCINISSLLTARLSANFNKDISILPYYGDLDEKTKEDILESFRRGDTLIVVGTDAFGLGVDIRDIMRIVQWQVTEKLDSCSLSQRIGRCVRNKNLTGVAIVFVKKTILEGIHPESWKEAWANTDPFAHDDMIFDNGDEDDRLAIAISKQRRLNCFSIPLLKETVDKCNSFTRQLYVPVSNLKEAYQRQIKEIKGIRKEPVTLAQKIDPGLLWILGSSGCKHRVLGWLFGDPAVWESTHKSWCCGSCIINRGDDLNNFNTEGISAGLNQWNPNPPQYETTPPPELPLYLQEKRQGPISRHAKSILRNRLIISRKLLWEEIAKQFPDTIPEIIIPDKYLDIIVKRVEDIANKKQLIWELEKAGWKIQHTLLDTASDRLFHVIDKTMKDNLVIPAKSQAPKTKVKGCPLPFSILT